MSYETVGENRVSLSHIDRTSGLEAVRPPCHDGVVHPVTIPYVRSEGF
jgi:hypothetical protein